MNINQLVNDLYPKKPTVLQVFLDAVRAKYTSISQLKGTYDEYGRLIAWNDDEYYDDNDYNYDDGENLHNLGDAETSNEKNDVCFKLKVVNYAKEHGSRKAAKFYDVKERQIRFWLKQENELLELLETSLKRSSKKRGGGYSKKSGAGKSGRKKKAIRVKFSKKKNNDYEMEEDPADDEDIEETPVSSRKRSGNSKLTYSDLPRLDRQDVDLTPPTAKKLKSEYDVDFKLEVINYAKQYGNFAASKQYDISRLMLRDWLKQEPILLKQKELSISSLTSDHSSPNRRSSDRFRLSRIDPLKNKIYRKITMDSPLLPFEVKQEMMDDSQNSASEEEEEEEEEEDSSRDSESPPDLNADGLYCGEWDVYQTAEDRN